MFIGHFAAGFAAKKIAPATPLPLLVTASQFVDLLWPIFLLLGLETVMIAPGITAVTPLDFTSYPITHSLLTSVLWGILFGGIVYIFRRNKRESIILAGLVMSHWVLDLLTHRPDLPIIPGGDIKLGLGLWYSVAGTLLVEISLFAAGIYLYRSTIAGSGRKVPRSFWLFAGFLGITYLANIFGDPPPSSDVIAIVGNSMWLLVVWAWWVERQVRKQEGETER